jgi:hypothetical protein
VFARAQDIDADLLALQVADRANRLVRKQLETSGMQTSQRRNRNAGIQAKNDRSRVPEGEIELAAGDHLRLRRAVHRNVADIREALRPQQVLGDVPGRDADGRIAA